MALSFHGLAAQTSPQLFALEVATRFDVALAKALRFDHAIDLPDISRTTSRPGDRRAPTISLDDPGPGDDKAAVVARVSETDEEFSARQRRMHNAYKRFAKELSDADSRLILSDITSGGMEALVIQDPDCGKRWFEMLTSPTVNDVQLRLLYHFSLHLSLAMILTGYEPAIGLLNRLLSIQPAVNVVEGHAKTPTASLAIWSKANHPSIRNICKARLYNANSDTEIAAEVLAASLCDKTEILFEVVDELALAGRPADICHALTIAGYCDSDHRAQALFDRFEGSLGYQGAAWKAASENYKRNKWARTWHGRMRDARTPLEFWQASVLFTKLVDGRYDIWNCSSPAASPLYSSFVPTVAGETKRRIEKWEQARKNKLFGEKAPVGLFLQH